VTRARKSYVPGGGSVRLRKDGRWEARSGGRVNKSFYGKTPEEAIRKLNVFRGFPEPDDLADVEGDGHVYFAQSLIGGPIKIGTAQDPQQRLKELQACCPFPLVFLHVVEGGGRSLEQTLHRRFRHHRLHGEWFDACRELLEYIHDAKARGAKRRAKAIDPDLTPTSPETQRARERVSAFGSLRSAPNRPSEPPTV
jgi:hypothetical protein